MTAATGPRYQCTPGMSLVSTKKPGKMNKSQISQVTLSQPSTRIVTQGWIKKTAMLLFSSKNICACFNHMSRYQKSALRPWVRRLKIRGFPRDCDCLSQKNILLQLLIHLIEQQDQIGIYLQKDAGSESF